MLHIYAVYIISCDYCIYIHTILLHTSKWHSFFTYITYGRFAHHTHVRTYGTWTDRQTDRQTDRPTDRPTDRHTYIHDDWLLHNVAYVYVYDYIYTYTCIHVLSFQFTFRRTPLLHDATAWPLLGLLALTTPSEWLTARTIFGKEENQ